MARYSPPKILALLTAIGLFMLALLPSASASSISPPTDFAVKKVHVSNGITLNWLYGNLSAISGFEIYRSVGDESNWILYATQNSTNNSYQDSKTAPDKLYYYKIRAYSLDWSGGSSYSDFTTPISARIPTGVDDPPAPTDLKVALDGNVAVLTWNDNSENEDSFLIQCSSDGGAWDKEASALAGVLTGKVTYRYTNLNPGTTYKFRVRAIRNSGNNSPFSNEVTATVSSSTPIPGAPIAPSNLIASAYQTAIALSWKDNSDNEDGLYLSRREANGTWKNFQQLIPGTQSYKDWDVVPGTSYSYKIQAFNHSGLSAESNIVTFTAPSAATRSKVDSKLLKFYVDSNTYYINDKTATMEVAPVIYHSRTMLPIAYIADPIGAQTTWDEASGKITISLNNKTIELWRGSNTARVNGAAVSIDANDLAVTPLVLPPGRTMVPLGFIAQNLGCTVNWNAATREVTINYFGK